ncbi:MAG: DUF302 domain-containing protein [Bacteroidota bacterium]|nr:DUF302 domain-containing protein [Bacteroidota bacterium]
MEKTSVQSSADKMMDMIAFKITSNVSIEEISERMPAECEKNKFSVLQVYNFNQILEGKGFPIERKARVFEVCRASMASKMLTVSPEFSIFMPCRIAVYEQEGQTVISTMNMELVTEAVKHNDLLFVEISGMFNSLKAIMAALAKD